MATLLSSLQELFGAENVLASGMDLLTAAFAPSSLRTGHANPLPLAVVRPPHLSQIPRLINFCREQGLPLRVRGGNSDWLARPLPESAIILDTSRLDRIVEFNPLNRTIKAQAGVRCKRVRDLAAAHGLFLPCFAPDMATVGAWLACNEWGPESSLYGSPSMRAISIRVFDGQGREGLYYTQNSFAGQLAASLPIGNLFCGSRGELGIAGEVTLSLLPMPQASFRTCAVFKDSSKLTESLLQLLEAKLQPAAAMLFNPACMEALTFPPAWALALEFQGASETLEQTWEMLFASIKASGGEILQPNNKDYANWLNNLTVILYDKTKRWQTETAGCSVERLRALLEGIANLTGEYGLDSHVFGPVISGRLHVVASMKDADKCAAFFHDLFVLDLVLNGLLESESEFPESREKWLASRYETSIDNQLREMFDPDSILGKALELDSK